MNTGVILTKIW